MNTHMKPFMTKGHTLYNPQKSNTYRHIENGEFRISYGDSSWATGRLASDTVSVGGATVQQQIFGLPIDVSAQLSSDTYSNGIVGIGFGIKNTFSPGPQKTFFENLAPSLDEPVLTARLRSDGVSEYEFGTIDHSKYTGQLVNISVNSANGYWQIDTPVYQVQVGNGTQRVENPSASAIVDTGSSLILADEAVVEMYYEHVPGALSNNATGEYIFPCNAQLPDLFIMFGYECKVPVPGWVMNYASAGSFSPTGEECELPLVESFFVSTLIVSDCYGGLQGNQGADFQILGDVFLKAYFVVFDHRGPSLGLASPT